MTHVVRRSCRKAHVDTKIVFSLFASNTVSAWDTWLHGHSIAFLQACDCASHLFNDPRGLMAKYHGLLDHKVSNGAICPVVNVRAADSRELDVNQHTAGVFDLRYRSIFECDVVRLVQNE